MKWKIADQFDGVFNTPAEAVAGAINTSLGKVKGKLIRITIEEAVDECCEKWSGLLGANDNCRDGTAWIQVFVGGKTRYHLYGPVVYCPTCGKKLL